MADQESIFVGFNRVARETEEFKDLESHVGVTKKDKWVVRRVKLPSTIAEVHSITISVDNDKIPKFRGGVDEWLQNIELKVGNLSVHVIHGATLNAETSWRGTQTFVTITAEHTTLLPLDLAADGRYAALGLTMLSNLVATVNFNQRNVHPICVPDLRFANFGNVFTQSWPNIGGKSGRVERVVAFDSFIEPNDVFLKGLSIQLTSFVGGVLTPLSPTSLLLRSKKLGVTHDVLWMLSSPNGSNVQKMAWNPGNLTPHDWALIKFVRCADLEMVISFDMIADMESVACRVFLDDVSKDSIYDFNAA